MKLDYKDRMILRNQYQILAYLSDGEDRVSHVRAIKILEEGYEGEYNKLLGRVTYPLSSEFCAEVEEILDMFSEFERSEVEDGTKLPKGKEHIFRFKGFKVTEAFASYAQFQIEEGRWEFLKSKNLVSDVEQSPLYETMVKAWKQSQNRHFLTEQDFDRIANAVV